jgi:hypothetical protein
MICRGLDLRKLLLMLRNRFFRVGKEGYQPRKNIAIHECQLIEYSLVDGKRVDLGNGEYMDMYGIHFKDGSYINQQGEFIDANGINKGKSPPPNFDGTDIAFTDEKGVFFKDGSHINEKGEFINEYGVKEGPD